MKRRNGLMNTLRWLLPVLALLLVLGHACEWSAYATVAITPHPAEASGHASHHSADDPELSCDPVDALTTSGPTAMAPILGAAQVVALDSLPQGRPVAESRQGSGRPAGKLPLFLLHAALLI